MSRDCRGTELRVGDIVATTGTYYKDLAVGEVLKLTPKGVRVDLHYLDRDMIEGEPYGVIRTSAQVVKLEGGHAS